MRTLIIMIASVMCLIFAGCATYPNINVATEKTQVAENFGLYLDPLDPARKTEAWTGTNDTDAKPLQVGHHLFAANYN